MQKFDVREDDEGRRLDQYLARLLPNSNTSFIYKMLRKKNITVNRKKADGNTRLLAGDSVEMFFSDETFAKMSGGSAVPGLQEYSNAYKHIGELNIVFEDEDFIFVDKPVDVLAQKSKPSDFSMNEWLIGYLLDKHKIDASKLATIKPAFVNRLDRNTSGIMLGGKTLRAVQLLSAMLKDRTLEKYYLATLEGNSESVEGLTKTDFLSLEAFLVKDDKSNRVKVFDDIDTANAYAAKTRSKVSPIHTMIKLLEDMDDKMRVEVDLKTGKSHQIRAHMAHIGHPIVGDPKYGRGSSKKGEHQLLRSYRVVFPVIDDYPSISGREFIAK